MDILRLPRPSLITALSCASLALTSLQAAPEAACCDPCSSSAPAVSITELARTHEESLRYSTLFMSWVINSHLTDQESVDRALNWCVEHGIRKVYLETYREEQWANRDYVVRARDAFRAAGIEVAGCITTAMMKKRGQHLVDGKWVPDEYLACYTDPATQDLLQQIAEETAALFDEFIIDDFYNTVCECEDCAREKGERTWAQFRCDLLLEMSQDRILAPARAVNPLCRITIKFPVWYDHLRRAGYDVERSTPIYDAIFTGTETRDPPTIADNPQYAAYFMMRLINDAGGHKNLGGWFDFIDTAPNVYVEQARQTILGQAPEVMLFEYSALSDAKRDAADMAALAAEMPQLFCLAEMIRGKTPRGVTVAKPLDSSDLSLPETKIVTDRYVFGFLGMLGIPLDPKTQTLGPYDALIGTQHLLYSEGMTKAFAEALKRGTPALITSGLRDSWPGYPGGAQVVEFKSKMELMSLPHEELNKIRNRLLEPLGAYLDAPARVSLHLYDSDLAVLENFNDEPVKVAISLSGVKDLRPTLTIPAGQQLHVESKDPLTGLTLPARSLVVLSAHR